MATISTIDSAGTGHQSRNNATNVPYVAEFLLDFAVAAAAKGSALAAADVIECIPVPAGSIVLCAGLECITAVDGSTSADNALDLGITGVEADIWVDGYDLDAAVAGTYSQFAADFRPLVVGSTADTIDVLIQAATTAPVSGVVRVFAVLVNVDGINKPGIAAVGS